MSRARNIVVASALLLTSAFAVFVTASQIALTWYLPPDDTGIAHQRVAVFEPAVVGTVVAALAALALLVHLLVVWRRGAPRWMWVTAAVVTMVAVIAAVAVSTADRPTF